MGVEAMVYNRHEYEDLVPMVSIIIPCYNAADFLAKAIDSCLQQDYKEKEIIVIDDGSTDATGEILKSYSNDVVIYTQSNMGACVARNKGVKLSFGAYVKFLDADDYLLPGSIRKQVEYAQKFKNGKTITYGASISISSNGQSGKQPFKMNDMESQTLSLIKGNILTTLPLYPKDALVEVEGFNEKLYARQEWDLNIRLSLAGYKFVPQKIEVYCQYLHDSPDRISTRKLNFEKEKNNLNIILNSHLESLNQDELAGWAWKFWGVGRQFLKNSEYKNAEYFFSKSKSISPSGYKKNWPFFYLIATRVFGVKIPEVLYLKLKSLLPNV